jgi:predicted DNA-binding transcriptional regulator AlpA
MRHLVGVAEVAQMLGVSRQRVHQIAKSAKDFPKPEAFLSAGKVWSKDKIEAWLASGEARGLRGRRPR